MWFSTRRLKIKDRSINRILGLYISTPGSYQFISIIGIVFSLLPYSFPFIFSYFLFHFHLQFLFFLFLFLFLFPSLPFSYSSSGLSLPYLLSFHVFCFSLSLSERVIRSIVFGGVSFLLLHGTSCISIVCLFPFLALFNCFPVLLNILSMCLGSDPYSIYVSALTYFFEKWHIISTHTL